VLNADALRALLSRGADVNAAANDGMTPLHFAAGVRGRSDCVFLLLRKGADRGMVNAAGVTARDLAAESGHDDCARLIDASDDLERVAREVRVPGLPELLKPEVVSKVVMRPLRALAGQPVDRDDDVAPKAEELAKNAKAIRGLFGRWGLLGLGGSATGVRKGEVAPAPEVASESQVREIAALNERLRRMIGSRRPRTDRGCGAGAWSRIAALNERLQTMISSRRPALIACGCEATALESRTESRPVAPRRSGAPGPGPPHGEEDTGDE
jgi:hypothetical protein